MPRATAFARAVSRPVGEVTQQNDIRASMPYQVMLRNGAKLEGVLPMQRDARG